MFPFDSISRVAHTVHNVMSEKLTAAMVNAKLATAVMHNVFQRYQIRSAESKALIQYEEDMSQLIEQCHTLSSSAIQTYIQQQRFTLMLNPLKTDTHLLQNKKLA